MYIQKYGKQLETNLPMMKLHILHINFLHNYSGLKFVCEVG